jgi:hypothetical protein
MPDPSGALCLRTLMTVLIEWHAIPQFHHLTTGNVAMMSLDGYLIVFCLLSPSPLVAWTTTNVTQHVTVGKTHVMPLSLSAWGGSALQQFPCICFQVTCIYASRRPHRTQRRLRWLRKPILATSLPRERRVNVVLEAR